VGFDFDPLFSTFQHCYAGGGAVDCAPHRAVQGGEVHRKAPQHKAVDIGLIHQALKAMPPAGKASSNA
jgi:hypothetical protein